MSQRRTARAAASRPRVTFTGDSGSPFDNSNLAENIPPQEEDRMAKRFKPSDDTSFADRFEKKWNGGRGQRYNLAPPPPPEPVDLNFSDDDIDTMVIGVPKETKEPRAVPSTQTPESVLRDIDQLVDRVHEICGRRPQ